jgi:hypothetical protein
VLQRRDLSSPQTAIRELAHQIRMLVFPLRPDSRVLENTARDHLLVVVGTLQRRLYAISGFAHESRVTDGMAEHRFPPSDQILVNVKKCQSVAICRQQRKNHDHIPFPVCPSRPVLPDGRPGAQISHIVH